MASNMHRLRFITIVLILSTSVSNRLGLAAPVEDGNGNAGSGIQWTPAAICAALAWREAKLRDCSFAFSEDCRVFHPGTSGENLYETSELLVRRKEGATFVDVSDRYTQPSSLERNHVLLLWDGSRSRSLIPNQHHDGKTLISARVDDEEPVDFSLYHGFNVFGSREFNKDQPWSMWLQSMLAKKETTSSVAVGIDDDRNRFVRLVVDLGEWPPLRYTFTFLPDKDFAAQDLHVERNYDKRIGTQTAWHVTRFKQYDGFWVPLETNYIAANKDLGNKSQIITKSFSLKAPTDAEMRIDFPVGTRVMDNIALAYYVILPEGKRKYERFYDAKTGKIITPAEEQQAATQSAH